MPWKFDDTRPVYLQIMDEVKQRVLTGVYKPGEKLPSVRELALEAAVNPNTMQRALSELERENFIHSERTSGRFVTEDLALIDSLRGASAQVILHDFITKLTNLGYGRDEILALVTQYTKKEEPENNVNS